MRLVVVLSILLLAGSALASSRMDLLWRLLDQDGDKTISVSDLQHFSKTFLGQKSSQKSVRMRRLPVGLENRFANRRFADDGSHSSHRS